MKILHKTDHGHCPPWGHGLVYTDYMRMQRITAILPLSFALRVCYLVWLWMRYPWRENLIEEREQKLNERVARIKARAELVSASAAFRHIDDT